ncbi:MAG TPA: PhoU domain-containing protein [Bryobacteraceae bacterium]|nr:PhoU domain-containing protein [Bryobacteraceae bacterium]
MTRIHYRDELELVRQHLIQMGETTINVYSEALGGIGKCDRESSERAQDLETQTDHQNRMIHEECLSLITLQSPVARDARLVTAILDAIVDLELIADYANEIASLNLEMTRRPMSQVLVQVSDTGAKIGEMLSVAIDSWRKEDRELALSVRPRETAVRAELQNLYEKLSKLMVTPGDGALYVTLLLIARHLERIMRHSVSVAEQAATCAPLP